MCWCGGGRSEDMIKCSYGEACNGLVHYECEDAPPEGESDEYVCSGCSSLIEYKNQDDGEDGKDLTEEVGRSEPEVSHACYCMDANKNSEETISCCSSVACGGEVHLSCESIDDLYGHDLSRYVCSYCDRAEYASDSDDQGSDIESEYDPDD